jgi:hypothetical protein
MAELTGTTLAGGAGGVDPTDPTDPTDGSTTTDGPTTTAPETPTTVAPDETTTSTTPEPIDAFALPALVALDEAGFARLQRVDGDGPVAGANLVVVFVTGSGSEFDLPAALFGELSKMSTDLGLPTVVAEVFEAPGDGEDDLDRGSTLSPWRAAEDAGVSTVDDLDLLAGRVATVLALADLRDGVIGHYGYGPDADRVLPEWSGP